jgi:hypothetical protein
VLEAHASPEGRVCAHFACLCARGSALRALAPVLALVLFGCGSSSHKVKAKKAASPLATVCTARGRTAVAEALGASPGSITERASISGQSYPQCVYRASAPRVRVTVIVDTGPQPFFRLERTAVEAQQVFSSVRNAPAPVQVPRLGLDADWFPDQDQVMTTDGRRLITAGVSWRHVKTAQMQRLAEAAARAYLGPLRHNPAQGY